MQSSAGERIYTSGSLSEPQERAGIVASARSLPLYREGGREKTGGGEDVLCNDYFSTMRAATDKRSSPVERADQVAKG